MMMIWSAPNVFSVRCARWERNFSIEFNVDTVLKFNIKWKKPTYWFASTKRNEEEAV